MFVNLKEQLKNKDVILGAVMVVSGGSLVVSELLISGIGLIVYGLYQAYGEKEKPTEQHHHHHHHNKTQRKKVTKKKNG